MVVPLNLKRTRNTGGTIINSLILLVEDLPGADTGKLNILSGLFFSFFIRNHILIFFNCVIILLCGLNSYLDESVMLPKL